MPASSSSDVSGLHELQRELARRVVTEDALGEVRRVAGADTSHAAHDSDAVIHGAVVVLDWPGLAVIDSSVASRRPQLPYIPGLLGFRECPALVSAFESLDVPADLIFVDGHGISHPRGLGVASHLGVLLDRPTIGVAKTILVGQPAGPVGPEPGDQAPLVWKGRQIGVALRTKRRCNPMFVSVGHRISLPTAVEWVMRSVRGYRLPEPTRQAHLAANVARRAHPAPPRP